MWDTTIIFGTVMKQNNAATARLDADLWVHKVQYRSTHQSAGHVHKQAGLLPDGPKCPLPHKSFCSPGTEFPAVQAQHLAGIHLFAQVGGGGEGEGGCQEGIQGVGIYA